MIRSCLPLLLAHLYPQIQLFFKEMVSPNAPKLPAAWMTDFTTGIDRVLKVEDNDYDGCGPADPINMIGK